MSQSKRRGLGRGLDALLTTPASNSSEEPNVDKGNKESELQNLPIEQLHPGKYQPRKDMSAEALDDLANSIKSQGIIQPIVVRPISDHSYEIIAGERRWRAAQIAELDNVPCLIKHVPDEAAVAIALIENIQREDLNAMEEAIADAGLSEALVTSERTGLVVGSGGPSTSAQIAAADITRDKGPKRVGPYAVPKAMCSSISANMSTAFHMRGLSLSLIHI